MNPSAWNSWVIGAVVAIFGFAEFVPGTKALSWINAASGLWVIISPWVFRYTEHTGRFVNSLCVGIVLIVLSVGAAAPNRAHTTRI